MIVEAFWDASVLVPLCVNQPPHTVSSEMVLKRYAVNVWWGTSVEIMSALTRLRRSGMTSELEFQAAKAQLSRMIDDWNLVAPSNDLKALAAQILENYALRAADAFQLAAALEWCESQSSGVVFLTADKRLAEAAGRSGFSLEPGLVRP
jgi:predicted nucleic acid-binding protein